MYEQDFKFHKLLHISYPTNFRYSTTSDAFFFNYFQAKMLLWKISRASLSTSKMSRRTLSWPASSSTKPSSFPGLSNTCCAAPCLPLLKMTQILTLSKLQLKLLVIVIFRGNRFGWSQTFNFSMGWQY